MKHSCSKKLLSKETSPIFLRNWENLSTTAAAIKDLSLQALNLSYHLLTQ